MNALVVIIGVTSESSIHNVCDWINYLGREFVILRTNDFESKIIDRLQIGEEQSIEIGLNGKSVNLLLSHIKSIWFRKRYLNCVYNTEFTSDESMNIDINGTIKTEFRNLQKGIYKILLNEHFCLGDPDINDINKISVLHIASKIGLSIPETFVLTHKKDLLNIVQSEGKYICKPIHSGFRYAYPGSTLLMYSTLVDEKFAEKIPDNFPPSLFQKYIVKEYEIRVFVIKDEFYGMAIFSQRDEQTKVDFRNYNWKNMNRMIPYKLPQELKSKLLKLFQQLGLNTGSADIIKSTDGKYYFLEVNPTGQYGFLSMHCNYNIDQVIAQHLINEGK